MISALIMGSPVRRLISPITRCRAKPHNRYAGTDDGQGTGQTLDTERLTLMSGNSVEHRGWYIYRGWRVDEGGAMKFNHVGIPTASSFGGEIPLPHLKMTVSDHLDNPFGIQWQRYWEDAPYPDLVKTVAHVAFEVDDLVAALAGQHVIIEPNSPSRGVTVAFIEVNGAPVELMQIDHPERADLQAGRR